MPDHHHHTIEGKITHIFGHRFVVQTADGSVLADLTPDGAEQVKLRLGDEVKLEGEKKPTELKVLSFTAASKTVSLAHKKKHDEHAPADPRLALKAAKDAGYQPVGEPRRKPKHFEVLGRRDKELTELHIELDGHIRKTKPADRLDPKWQEELSAS